MKMIEAFKHLDKNHEVSHVDLSNIAEELNLDSWGLSEGNGEIVGYELITWVCTDTLVGVFAYLFKGEPAFVTVQEARKNSTFYYWVSTDMYTKVKDFIISLSNDQTLNNISLIDELEIDEYFTLEYSGQCDRTHKCYYDGSIVDVVKQPCKNPDGSYNFHTVVIQSGWDNKEIDIRDLKFKTKLTGMNGDVLNEQS